MAVPTGKLSPNSAPPRLPPQPGILGKLPSLKWARRIAVAVIGFTVLLVGLAMVVLPGPAVVVIPLGLGILATEFIWARKLIQRVKCRLKLEEEEKACAPSPTPPPQKS